MIRDAHYGDLGSIQAILSEPANWGKLEGYEDAMILAAINDNRTPIFVWEEDGQWKGFCWLRLTPEGTKIEEFGVSEPGRGTGSRFFAAVVQKFSQDGFALPLWLAVAADNVEAIRFYQSFGFVEGDLKKAVWKRRAGPIADALIMTHALAGPTSVPSRDQDMRR